ncbi:MAG: tRNA pseudouridine(38-40) synthase TruA [Planctomycetales bacterium]|nr:tRNA pseudouridine(38-40) synthase TruA [Planctomycetales bacterium]
MRNIGLTLAYDGTNFCGWQVQSNGPSIQAEVERAVEKLTGTHSGVLSAGRTDSGVHALGQVANFHTESRIPADKFRPALQTFLPHDIVVLDSFEVPLGFHATFSAKRKRYRYVIYNSRISLPFLRHYVYLLSAELDMEVMQAAAQALVGTHDFRSFETDWPNKPTSVRTVSKIEFRRLSQWEVWSSTPPLSPFGGEGPGVRGENIGAGNFIVMEIVADGFLYNMVRTIVGTLINVGRHTWSVADVQRILHAQSRSTAGATAPACGLYLVDVDYGDAMRRDTATSAAESEVPAS